MEVGGVVWVAITDIVVGGEVSSSNFVEICGRRNMSKSVVALSYRHLVPKGTRQTEEGILRKSLKGSDMDSVHIQPIDDRPESAWQVIDYILKSYVKDGGDGVVLDLVDQLVRNQWRLEETGVGRTVLGRWGNNGSVKRLSLTSRILAMFKFR